MKLGRTKFIGGAILACLTILENISFASPNELAETNNPVNNLRDKNKTADVDDKSQDPKVLPKVQTKLPAGLQQYETDGSKRIRAFISFGLQNRFQVTSKKIREVIGQGFLYSINSDESGNHVFITPVSGVGERIDLTFICDDNKAVDLSLIVKEGGSQSVIIKEKESSLKAIEVKTEQEIAADHMLRMMIKDRKSRYDVEILNKSLPNKLSSSQALNLSFAIDRRYGWAKNNLKGLRVTLKNHGLKTIWLTPDMISDLFEDVKSVHIANIGLQAGESTFAYVIRSDGQFGQNGERE